MGEKAGQRETIDRMTNHIVTHSKGQTSAAQAREIARQAAIRHDQRKDGERK